MKLTVIGAPASAGSHNAGQEDAPAALRAAGLIEQLRAAGIDVDDAGDLQSMRRAVAKCSRCLD